MKNKIIKPLQIYFEPTPWGVIPQAILSMYFEHNQEFASNLKRV
jgi:hypothetical protein